MKFNIQIDLDWINEDSSVDDVIKEEITRHIEERVYASLIEPIETKTKLEIEAKVEEMVSSAITDKINKFLNSPEDIEQAISQKVLNAEGQRPPYNSNTQYTRLEYFAVCEAKKTIHEFIEKHMKDAQAIINKHAAEVEKSS